MLGVANGNVTLRNVEIPYYYRWKAVRRVRPERLEGAPNLTLNLGVRYSLQMPRTEKYDNQGVFRPDWPRRYLPTPLTLQTVKSSPSTQVPPFAFRGRGGNSRYLMPPDYMEFRAALRLRVESQLPRERTIDTPRRLRPLARPDQRCHPLPQPGFRRHHRLCHARSPPPRPIRTTSCGWARTRRC